MAKKDIVELLSKRLVELHELMFSFMDVLSGCAENGLLEKSLVRRAAKYDSADGDLRALIRALNHLGEKLAWLDQADTQDGKPRQSINRFDRSEYDDFMAQFSDPPTGNRLGDTVMELTNTLIQRHWLLFKLAEDCEKGRFNRESDCPSEDITRVLAGLALDQQILFDLFCRIMLVLSLESKSEADDQTNTTPLEQRRIQEENVLWLSRFHKARQGS